ncbi:WecB/TagA/CpsF family glycosyltransferase [Flagellimonas meishanensis]|uniref:WecB/TagA/CpsF family glycosyltransferase n=1 Tax=Flagellimonas meishanensis TaxID=2873264 RepID=UPI001CA753FE|nr:WecB/TagA/CpsF family glycosyltransferase [[Muricauda] meishanensis]
MQIESCPINGKRVFAFTSKKQFLEYINDQKKILVALNAEKLNKKSKVLDKIINSNIGYPDGMGAVWALKRKGLDSVKIAGAEFWLDIIKKNHKNKSIYLMGSTQHVIEQTVAKLKSDYPALKVTGYRDGFLKEGDKEKLVEDLKQQKPDVVYVAMGSPRQELLMNELMSHYPALYMGLGGSFDVYMGLKKRAPVFFQKLGLEWFYRLLKEPTRISRQTSLAKFLIKVIFDKI